MRTTILYLSAKEAKPLLGSYRLGPAMTILEDNHFDATIIVNRNLPTKVREAFLAHEGSQLGVIRKMFRRGFRHEQSCYAAHEAGVAAGRSRAEKLGVLVQYTHLQERK